MSVGGSTASPTAFNLILKEASYMKWVFCLTEVFYFALRFYLKRAVSDVLSTS